MAPNQVLTVFGHDLDGAAMTFDGEPATVLYNSPAQVNLVAPRFIGGRTSTVLRVSPDSAMEVPVIAQMPSLFADLGNLEADYVNCYRLIAHNPDGSFNSRDNPAKVGSVVSVYLNGVTDPASSFGTFVEGKPAELVGLTAENEYVMRADVRLPMLAIRPQQSVGIAIRVNGAVAGPSSVTTLGGTVNSINSGSFLATYIPAGVAYYTYVWGTP